MAKEGTAEIGLAEAWRPFFHAATRARGNEYRRSGLVEIIELTGGHAEALVLGRGDYLVFLDWRDRGEIRGSCSCPAFESSGPCKHMWAAVLEVDLVLAGDKSRGGALERREPREGSWRARLDELRHTTELERRDPWLDVAEPDFEVRYVIQVEASELDDVLVLETRVHQRKKSGEWGEGRAFSPKVSLAPPVGDPLDRKIFAALQGAVGDETFEWNEPQASSRHHLGPELAAVTLPMLVATGRLFASRKAILSEALDLDYGPEWRPSFDLERDEVAGFCVLRATLIRGEERMDVSAPDVLLEGGFLLVNGVIARFDPSGAWPVAQELRTDGPLRVPIAEHARLLEVLGQLPARVFGRVDGMQWASPIAPRPCLRVEAPPSRRAGQRLDCRIQFEYGAALVDPEDPRASLAVGAEGAFSPRDFVLESGALRRFLGCGGAPAGDEFTTFQGTVRSTDLPAMAAALLADGWRVEAEGKRWRQSQGFALSVRSGTDWFDLEGGMDFGGEAATLPALLAAARAGTRTVELGDGSLGLLPEKWLEDWGLLGLASKELAGGLRFARNQGWLLDAMLLGREGVDHDQGFAKLRERLADFRGIAAGMEPRGFQGTLRGYQRLGLGWFEFLRDVGLGGCLADDMGLGKTVQVLALLESRRLDRLTSEREPVMSLVVAPRSLVFNWIDEAAHFTPRLAVLDYTGVDRRERLRAAGNVDLLVTTYGTLRRDAPELAERRFDYVVLDEATAIKNAGSQSAKAARLLTAEHRLALSGTPIENHLGDLWSLFEFLNPGMLGRSRMFQDFVTKNGGRKDAGAPDLERLARAIRPFFLRRTKDEVLDDLPEKTEQTIHCELGRSERKDYDELRAHYRASLLQREEEVGLGRMKIHVLEALLRLRQAALHPGLIDPKRKGETSAKLEALLPMLEQLVGEGHKALVYSQFTKLLDIVRSRLDASGIPYEYLDGRTRNRKERVERFQKDRACPLFLISLKAGGHGLNLTAADYVFLLDPWWNPAVEAQAVDRAHRIGRTRPVVAYRLIAMATVEEKVLDLQTQKRELVKTLLGEGRAVLKDLTREDLERLLS